MSQMSRNMALSEAELSNINSSALGLGKLLKWEEEIRIYSLPTLITLTNLKSMWWEILVIAINNQRSVPPKLS